MKLKQILGPVTLVVAGLVAPQIASASIDAVLLRGADTPKLALVVSDDHGAFEIARGGRGGDDGPGHEKEGDDDRGRGRGSDDSRSGGHDHESGSGRKKPRVPGGSGCDDPGDIREHKECRG